MDIKLIITDIDGVWTDGGMYYTEGGDEIKKFNTSDSVGVLLAREAGVDVAIITGENSNSVKMRAKKLKIEACYTGISNKVELVQNIMKTKDLSWDEIAFIGDEVNDLQLLKKVAISGCPQSAPVYTKNIVDIVVDAKGGEGAFRDFVIEVLKQEKSRSPLLSSILGEQ